MRACILGRMHAHARRYGRVDRCAALVSRAAGRKIPRPQTLHACRTFMPTHTHAHARLPGSRVAGAGAGAAARNGGANTRSPLWHQPERIAPTDPARQHLRTAPRVVCFLRARQKNLPSRVTLGGFSHLFTWPARQNTDFLPIFAKKNQKFPCIALEHRGGIEKKW